jgi:hypothetical protein
MSDSKELVERLRYHKQPNATAYVEQDCTEAISAIEALEAEVEDLGKIAREQNDFFVAKRTELIEVAERRDILENVLTRTAASLAAAISLLERGGESAKKAAPSNKMFDQMLADYRRALDGARKALEPKP